MIIEYGILLAVVLVLAAVFTSRYRPWRRSGARVYPPAGLARSAVRQQPGPLSFDTGLASLTRELSNPGTPLVNDHRRRHFSF